MPGKGDSKLTLTAETKGFKEGADDVKKLGTAQAEAGKTTAENAEKVSKANEKLGDTQKQVNASTDTWISLLNNVHPALGAMADAAVKGVSALGDLATQSISIRRVLGRATKAARKHAAALKLIGAGGAAAASIAFLTKTVFALQEAQERAAQAAQRDKEALNEQKRAADELNRSLRDQLNLRRRMATETVESIESATARDRATLASVGRQDRMGTAAAVRAALQGAVDEETIKTLILAEIGGGGVLTKSGGGERFTAGQGIGLRRSMAMQLVGQEDIQAAAAVPRQQFMQERIHRAQQAFRETRTAGRVGGATTAGLESFVRSLGIVNSEEDVKEIARVMQFTGGGTERFMVGPGSLDVLARAAWSQRTPLKAAEDLNLLSPIRGDHTLVDNRLIPLLETAITQMNKLVEQGLAGSTVQHNGRYYGADGAAFQRRVTTPGANGNSRRHAERVP